MDEVMNQGNEVLVPLNTKLPFWSDEFWKCMSDRLDSSNLKGSKNATLLFLGDEIIKLFPKHFRTSPARDDAGTTGAYKSFQDSFDAVGFCADLTIAALEFDLFEVNE